MTKILRKLASYYKPYMPLFLADMFFAIVGAGITLVIPLIVRYITNEVLALNSGQAFDKIVWGCWLLLLWSVSVIILLQIMDT